MKKFTKERCLTYLAVDGLGPSAHQDNSAIRQLLKKYDVEKIIATVNNSADKCHATGSETTQRLQQSVGCTATVFQTSPPQKRLPF